MMAENSCIIDYHQNVIKLSEFFVEFIRREICYCSVRYPTVKQCHCISGFSMKYCSANNCRAHETYGLTYH